jgi:mono/diheme cytochrome c family protein
MKRQSASCTIAAVLVPLVLLATAAHAADQPVKRGLKHYGDNAHGGVVFKTWCATCHSIDVPASDQIPTARQLATNPKHTDSAIRGFLVHPHKPMPPLEISTQQIEDIIAYLHTLQPGTAKTP